jgi:inorganic pyrophosphatase/exopolyphosphatase
MKTITVGSIYIDIDGYGGMVAYAELLRLLGEPARAVSTAVINESVPQMFRELAVEFESAYTPVEDEEFIVIDNSDPDYFEKFVLEEKVVEVIDHHPGFENYWMRRIGKGAQIEVVGAACTQIFEKWKQVGKLQHMSKTSAMLLAAGILDNTINFKAKITTDRDIQAYAFLAQQAGLDDAWAGKYFAQCQDAILVDIAKALKNDTKQLVFRANNIGEISIGQLVIWDSDLVLKKHKSIICETMDTQGELWMVNIIDIQSGHNILIAKNSAVKKWAKQVLSAEFDEDVAVLDRLWLRKEIMKADQLAA